MKMRANIGAAGELMARAVQPPGLRPCFASDRGGQMKRAAPETRPRVGKTLASKASWPF